jgi:pilus assembly protein CpaB
MKWAIVGLGLLGIVAALSAAFLVSSLRVAAMSGDAVVVAAAEPAQVSVLCAAANLQPMTVLDGTVVKPKLMPRNQAPVGCLTNPTDVVGKILVTPMTEGEAFTALNFTSTSALKQVATVIPPGMRAMGISITDYASLVGLLYPGSTVDVIASLKVKSPDPAIQTEKDVSITLLENIQVLAIEDQTVVSPPKGVTDVMDTSAPRTGNQRITLLVTTRQAKSLGLAMTKGTLSLTLRNPLDAAHGEESDVWEDTLLQGGARVNETPVRSQGLGAQWSVEVLRNNAVQTSSFPVTHQVK